MKGGDKEDAWGGGPSRRRRGGKKRTNIGTGTRETLRKKLGRRGKRERCIKRRTATTHKRKEATSTLYKKEGRRKG